MYDSGKRRKAQRKQRERGVSVFIPWEELQAAGFAHDGPIFYRVQGRRRGSIHVQLYREQ